MNMLRLEVDVAALARWAHNRRIASSDAGYLLHAAMRKAFGEHAPQPFVYLEAENGGRGEVLGYGPASDAELFRGLERLGDDHGEPWLRQGFRLTERCCKAFPGQWEEGRVLRFTVLACPLRRCKSAGDDGVRRTLERDAFLVDLERAGRNGLPAPDRTGSYIAWLEEQLARDNAAGLEECRLLGHRLIMPVRRGETGHAGAPHTLGKRPEARFEGVLSVRSPEGFAALVARGVGRHRAFGYGMLLLRAL